MSDSHVPASAADERSVPSLHNGSTSSSNVSSPTGGVHEIFRALEVRVCENERWFPVIGWGTSRLLTDPPNLSPWPFRVNGKPRTNPAVEALHVALLQENHIVMAPEGTQRPQQPVFPLNLQVPAGYMWAGYWEVSHKHPRGADVAGWRYAEAFTTTDPDGSHRVAHFKKTQTPTCVVRRRLWQRAVTLVRTGPTDLPASEQRSYSPRRTDEEACRELYLEEKQEEMRLAEQLKARRQHALDSGAAWTQTDDLAAEEELRTFIRERRQKFTESASRRIASNTSFANPFHAGDPDTVATVTPTFGAPARAPPHAEEQDLTAARFSGAAAATSWAVDGKANRDGNADEDIDVSDDEEFVKDLQRRQLDEDGAMSAEDGVAFVDQSRPTRPDGMQSSSAAELTFQAHTPSPTTRLSVPMPAVRREPTIERFVMDSADSEDDQDGGKQSGSDADSADPQDFDAIFSKFMSGNEAAGEPNAAE